MERYLEPQSFIIYLGLEIHEWFSSQIVGYSVTLTLLKKSSNSKTVCFALSTVVELPCEDIEFSSKLEYKDGHAQDGTISMSGKLTSPDIRLIRMFRFEGSCGLSRFMCRLPYTHIRSSDCNSFMCVLCM